MGWYEDRELIKQCNLEWIQTLQEKVEQKDGRIEVCVMNRKIDFWPYSDTYYLHSQGKYGVGIAQLCQKIKGYVEKKKT
jgi:hypothetical protein